MFVRSQVHILAQRTIVLTEVFHDFLQSTLANAGTVIETRSQLLLTVSFPINYSLIIL
jgi:hypothetical protein